MNIYPYSTPIILDDSTFVQYGGVTGTTTPAMRTAAYQIAEQQMTNHIGTFLLPTVVTETWDYTPGIVYLATQYGYVSNLKDVQILDPEGKVLSVVTGSYYDYAAIRDDTFGYLYVQNLLWFCNYYVNRPFKFSTTYTAGLPTGVANQPGMLMALTGAAQISLNEMLIVPANEGVGDVGIEEFTSLDYHEKRKKWHNTAFGSSAKASKIAQLVDSTVKKARRAVMLGSSRVR